MYDFQMKVNQLRDVLCWASTATDNGSDCYGVFVYLLEEVKLLGSGWWVNAEGKVIFGEWVYNSFLVH